MQSHQDIDARNLARRWLLARKVTRDPSLRARAQHTVTRWQTLVSASAQPCRRGCKGLLAQGAGVCPAVAVEDSPRAAALRQSSPFNNILGKAERFAFLKSWKPHATMSMGADGHPSNRPELAAGRNPHWPLVQTMLQHGIVDAAEPQKRPEALSVAPGRLARPSAWPPKQV